MTIHQTKRGTAKGFTLTELMIVVVITAILAAISIPAYKDVVYSGRRSDAQQSLLNAVNRQEQFFLDNRGYASTIGALNISGTSSEGYYNITLANTGCGSTPCYIFTATATGPQSGDAACTSLTIRTDGTKGKTGTGTVSDCW